MDKELENESLEIALLLLYLRETNRDRIMCFFDGNRDSKKHIVYGVSIKGPKFKHREIHHRFNNKIAKVMGRIVKEIKFNDPEIKVGHIDITTMTGYYNLVSKQGSRFSSKYYQGHITKKLKEINNYGN